MSYDFKRLVDVETIDKIPDDAELFCIVNDEIKKVNKNGLGIKAENGNSSSINSDEFGAICLRFPNGYDIEDITEVHYDESFSLYNFYDMILSSVDDPENNQEELYNMFRDIYYNEEIPMVYIRNGEEKSIRLLKWQIYN